MSRTSAKMERPSNARQRARIALRRRQFPHTARAKPHSGDGGGSLQHRAQHTDDGNAVPGSTLRSSYDLLADSFGPGFNGQIAVAVETKGGPDDTRALRDIRAAVADDRGVASVSRPALSPAGDLADRTFVGPQLRRIFAFRKQATEHLLQD